MDTVDSHDDISLLLLAGYGLTVGVTLFTAVVLFVLDYQVLKSKCEFYVLIAKCSSLDDSRDYFLRSPSSALEYIKVIYARIVFDIIGVFYESTSAVKETEMTLCASWSLVILFYLFTCQKIVFTTIVVAYTIYQCFCLARAVESPRKTYDQSDTSSEEKYESMREACSGNVNSFEKLMKGAENLDHVSAGFVVFLLTSNESNIDPDFDKAAKIASENLDTFFEAASQGDIFAQATMAFLHMRGIYVPKDDSEALSYALKSIKTGHPYANLILGWVYLAREVKEPELSYKYLKLAAKAGLASAQNSMGALNLLQSEKYAPNPKKALYWFKQAALQNLRGAEFNLGALYNSDVLVDCEPAPSFFSFGGKSRKEVREGFRNDAIYWLMLASQHGHRLADAELRKAECGTCS